MAVVPTLPYAHYSPNLYPACPAAQRAADGECLDDAVVSDAGGSAASVRKGKASSGRRNGSQTVGNLRTISGELVAEIDAALSEAQADALARRHGLARVASQSFPLLDATIGLFRITDRRPADAVRRELAADGSVHAVQPNFRYLLQQQTASSEGDPAQYALAKLRLPEAHTLAHGADVRIAVIDSSIEADHPELAGSIVEQFDALGSKEGPHVHGTGIAGAIASHARLMGGAPKAQILAIRAFGVSSGTAQSSSYVVLKALDYAAAHKAQIVNMSFAGPKDTLIERGIAALAGRGIVMVAAAGNAGAKSPPLYPAANPHVIAVSATNAQDELLAASNRGSYVCVAAPGADIFLPAPDGKYQMTSGTSFSAAYVSALAALMLERHPGLKPEEVRAILTRTARDLGSPGRDDLFGAGEADAFAAVQAATPSQSQPVAAISAKPGSDNAAESLEIPVIRPDGPPVAAAVSEQPVSGETRRPPAQDAPGRQGADP
jgi:subtilisin family serine protease